MDEWGLLRQYVDENSEAAFASLVERYINLVYSTCLREVHDAALAEDVTQAVFLILARKAQKLHSGTPLSNWLYQTARFAARNAMQRETRRQSYEQQAAQEMMRDMMHEMSPDKAVGWQQLEPLLHEALNNLSAGEREVVLLRFFEGKSLRETGAALNITEEGARKRIGRAIEKLRRYFSKRGFLVSGVALAGLLAENSVQAAPTSISAAILKLSSVANLPAAWSEVLGAKVASLCHDVLRTMLIKKTVVASTLLTATGLGGTGIGYLVIASTTNVSQNHASTTSLVSQGVGISKVPVAKAAPTAARKKSTIASTEPQTISEMVTPAVVADKIKMFRRPALLRAQVTKDKVLTRDFATSQDNRKQESKDPMKKPVIVAVVGSQLLNAAVAEAQPADQTPQKRVITVRQQPVDIGPPALVNTVDPAKPQDAGNTKMYMVPVRNVRPGIMAWWLDPAHNPMPVEFATAQKNQEILSPGTRKTGPKPTASKAAQGSGISAAVQGLGKIIPVDSQNCLLVYGTPQAATELKFLIGHLDRPLPQIEIEAHFVEISPQDVKLFTNELIQSSPQAVAGMSSQYSIGFVRENFSAKLNALVEQKKAKVIQAPRVTALNNFQASLFYLTSVPAVIGARDESSQFKELFESIPGSASPDVNVAVAIGLNVTPTVNEDGSVTMVIALGKSLLISYGEEQSESVPLRAVGGVSSVVNVMDGDTFVFTGLPSKLLSQGESPLQIDAEPSTPSHIALFVTPRIVKRATEQPRLTMQPAGPDATAPGLR